jgi:hypothetical protein
MIYIQYTRKDLEILLGILGPYSNMIVRYIARACEKALKKSEENIAPTFFSVCLYSYYISKKEYQLLFQKTLENVPLHINDKNPIIQAIAKWRLTIAK